MSDEQIDLFGKTTPLEDVPIPEPEEPEPGQADAEVEGDGQFCLFGKDIFGNPIEQAVNGALRQRYIAPPFTVFDARMGAWQERKDAWLNCGIESEIGRGVNLAYDLDDKWARGRRKLAPGGNAFPATDYNGQRGDGKGRDLMPDTSGTSIFDPVLCEIIYNWFCPAGGQVVDPFAGGSVRGIIANLLGRQYWGCDLSAAQVEANRGQAEKILRANNVKGGNTAEVESSSEPELTPVYAVGDAWVKRDDYAAGGLGAKGRAINKLIDAVDDPKIIISGAGRRSVQSMVAAKVARRRGLKCRIHTPAGEDTPEMLLCAGLGAEIERHRPGYATVIIAKANADAADNPGSVCIKFGGADDQLGQLSVDEIAAQAANLPAEIKRIIVCAGSGVTAAGILKGTRARALPVKVIEVGMATSDNIKKYAGSDFERCEIVKPAGSYNDPAPIVEWRGIAVDPYYEAKAAPHVMAGDLFWISGNREQQGPQQEPAPAAAPAPVANGLTWIAGDSAVELDNAPAADLIFSCPPYGDLEVYSDDPRDLSNMVYEQFLTSYKTIIKKAAGRLQQDRFGCFVVGEFRDKKSGYYRGFVADTIKAFKDAGMELYNEAILITMVGSQPVRAERPFNASRKLSKGHQNVLIFVKGDPVKATEAIKNKEEK